jgi:hypothetical protein
MVVDEPWIKPTHFIPNDIPTTGFAYDDKNICSSNLVHRKTGNFLSFVIKESHPLGKP